MTRKLLVLVAVVTLAFSQARTIDAGAAQPKSEAAGAKVANTGGGPVVLWRSPGDIASRNLFYGPIDKEHSPHRTLTFLEEDLDGTNPKFEVRDEDGVKWKAKLGDETRPETVASRLLWAVGYFTDENCFHSDMRIEDMPRRLKRGQDLVEPGGLIHNVRLEREPKGKKIGAWQWRHNPFAGTRELHGLRIMMALINSWDLKDQNTAVYMRSDGNDPEGSQQIYMISDLGASFGASGRARWWRGEMSPGNLEVYSHTKFISKITPEYVDFVTPTQPALPCAIGLPFFGRICLQWIGKHIPRADAKWMGQLLAQLTPDQIRDAFRAAAYSPQEVEGFTKVLQGRIAELNKL